MLRKTQSLFYRNTPFFKSIQTSISKSYFSLNKRIPTEALSVKKSLFQYKPFNSFNSQVDICAKRDRGFLFKQSLQNNEPKFGIFVNSASSTVAEQLSFSGYDWLLIDMQHGPMDYTTLSSMLSAVSNGNALSMVRVAGPHDRQGIQQALDLGANGILVPYVNTVEEAREAVSCCLYPTNGTRSVYFPQRATNRDGLLGYVGNSNKNVVVALQVETQSCVENIDAILALKGLNVAFLGQNDLCMSMGLFEKYEFPQMYSSPELNDATDKMLAACKKNNVIPGLFLFGTDRVGEFLKKGFTMISVGNDLHHVLTQAGTHLDKISQIRKSVGK